MSHFTAASVPTRALDPFKRVNYTLGMILGKDDFEQEQTYFVERDRLQNRLLHGYGTAFGLQVTADGAGSVEVAPGIAVDPLGREIRVAQAQCGNVLTWLAANLPPDPRLTAAPVGIVRRLKQKPGHNAGLHHDIGQVLEGADPAASVYVVLKYRECQSDLVPLPEGACCSEDANLAASRLTETFDLLFTLTAPDQAEEAAVRTFGDLLARIRIVPSPGSTTLADLVRILSEGMGDAVPTDLLIGADEAEGTLESLFRVWVTEIRPAIAGPGADPGVLLARLDLAGESGEITVAEAERPYLLHTRLLQEYLLRRPAVDHHQLLLGLDLDDHKQYLLVSPTDRSLIANLDAAGHKLVRLPQAGAAGEAMPYGQNAGGDLTGTLPLPTVAGLQGRPVADTAPADKEALTYSASAQKWQPAGPYLRVDTQGALVADLNATAHKISNLPQAAANGEAMPYGQTAGGDLSGTLPKPAVAALQGTPVATVKPAQNQVLTFDGSKWLPAAAQGGGIQLEQVAAQLPTTPFVTIRRIPALPGDGPTYRLWFHVNVGDPGDANVPEIVRDLPPEAIQVFQESDATGSFPFLTPIAVGVMRSSGRNLFDVALKADGNPDLLRFVFTLKAMKLAGRMRQTLADWVQKRPMKWAGHDGAELVTAFYKEEQPLRSFNVAAGGVAAAGQELFVYVVEWGNISIVDFNMNTGIGVFTFPGYYPEARYVVHGTPRGGAGTFMTLGRDRKGIQMSSPGSKVPITSFDVMIMQFEGMPSRT